MCYWSPPLTGHACCSLIYLLTCIGAVWSNKNMSCHVMSVCVHPVAVFKSLPSLSHTGKQHARTYSITLALPFPVLTNNGGVCTRLHSSSGRRLYEGSPWVYKIDIGKNTFLDLLLHVFSIGSLIFRHSPFHLYVGNGLAVKARSALKRQVQS